MRSVQCLSIICLACDIPPCTALHCSVRFGGDTYTDITICTNGYIDLGDTGTCSPSPKTLGTGSSRIAAFWNDLYADGIITDCELSGVGTFGSLVSHKGENTNNPLVDAMVHASSAPGAASFRSSASFTVSYFGLRLYSLANTTSSCNQRVHAQITVARSADDADGFSTTYAVLQYTEVQPELLGTAVRAGITTASDKLQVWPSFEMSGASLSQALGSSSNAGAPGRWVFRVDAGRILYGPPYPNFVPAESNRTSAASMYTLSLLSE